MSSPHITLPSSTTYSPTTTLPTPLRSSLNSALLSSGGITRIQASLIEHLKASGWMEAVRERCVELLRNGECVSFGEMMGTIVAEVRAGVEQGGEGRVDGSEELNEDTTSSGNTNGKATTDGVTRRGGRQQQPGLAIPAPVIKAGLSIVRKEIDDVVDIADE
ncbi:MAG: hypothetical protein M1827_006204 [Pycnora praestabilis]|nr:MAG: hypothetical protein M1827_006204 [Pycnora praestabilis]